MQARPICCYAVSVCLSVCLSLTFVQFVKTSNCILKFSHSKAILVFHIKRHGNIPTKTPITEASNAGGVGKNRDSERIAGYRSMTAGHASNYCDGRPCSLPHRCTDASLNLSITACNMAEYAEEKRTVQNILVLGSKAEAEVTTNKRQISSAASSLSGVRCKALAANAIWSIFRSNNASAGYHTNADYICS